MIAQRTLNKAVLATTTSSDLGDELSLLLRPGGADSGIRVNLSDPTGRLTLRISPQNTGATLRSLACACDQGHLFLIRGLLSAFAGLGIDNARVDITTRALSIRRLQTGHFVSLLQTAGLKLQASPRRFVRVKRRVTVEDGDRKAVLEPFDGFMLALSTSVDPPSFSGWRDAVFAAHSDTLLVNLGRSPATALLYGSKTKGIQRPRSAPTEVTCPSARDRESDPPCRERAAYQTALQKDTLWGAIGDLYLLGRALIGAFIGLRTDPALNCRLLQQLIADPAAWEEVTFENEGGIPLSYAPPVRTG